jgi:hypothetical protein
MFSFENRKSHEVQGLTSINETFNDEIRVLINYLMKKDVKRYIIMTPGEIFRISHQTHFTSIPELEHRISL